MPTTRSVPCPDPRCEEDGLLTVERLGNHQSDSTVRELFVEYRCPNGHQPPSSAFALR